MHFCVWRTHGAGSSTGNRLQYARNETDENKYKLNAIASAHKNKLLFGDRVCANDSYSIQQWSVIVRE